MKHVQHAIVFMLLYKLILKYKLLQKYGVNDKYKRLNLWDDRRPSLFLAVKNQWAGKH